MNYFIKEPQYQHGDVPKIGIILANLGTPDSLSTHAVRKYLQQFLMDRRVVEVPRFIWCWILYFIILVFRPGSSAKKYAKVWTKKGSPLLVNATNQTKALSTKIKKAVSQPVEVELGNVLWQSFNEKCSAQIKRKKLHQNSFASPLPSVCSIIKRIGDGCFVACTS